MKYHQPFVYEDTGVPTSVIGQDGQYTILFADTVVYPGGGGQPRDTGKVKGQHFSGSIIDAEKVDEGVLLKVEGKGTIDEGEPLTVTIDKSRRDRLVKMHTGEHILFKSLEQANEDIALIKIDLGEEESSLFLSTDKITWDEVLSAELTANSIIMQDRPIKETLMTKEAALALGELRIKPERIDADNVRVVHIQDFDWSACMGTHAPRTGFVGNIFITHFSVTKGDWEIRFKVDSDDVFTYAGVAREALSVLETDIESALEDISRLQEQVDIYKGKFRALSTRILDYYEEEQLGVKKLLWTVVEGVEKKQLVDKSSDLFQENTVVFFASIQENRALLVLRAADAPALLKKVLSKVDGKGGGRGDLAMGSMGAENVMEGVDVLRKILRQ